MSYTCCLTHVPTHMHTHTHTHTHIDRLVQPCLKYAVSLTYPHTCTHTHTHTLARTHTHTHTHTHIHTRTHTHTHTHAHHHYTFTHHPLTHTYRCTSHHQILQVQILKSQLWWARGVRTLGYLGNDTHGMTRVFHTIRMNAKVTQCALNGKVTPW